MRTSVVSKGAQTLKDNWHGRSEHPHQAQVLSNALDQVKDDAVSVARSVKSLRITLSARGSVRSSDSSNAPRGGLSAFRG